MKSTSKFLAMLVCAAFALPTFLVNAQEGEKEKTKEKKETTEKTTEKTEKKSGGFVGKVSVTTNDKKKVESITLTCDDGKTYTIPVAKGAKLAKEADGEYVEATGTVTEKKSEKGDELVLNLAGFQLVFKGAVAVTKDGEKITGVTIGGTEVKLDGKGKELAEKADGKEVVATGAKVVKKDKNGESTIAVIKSYKLADETEKKKEK